MKIPNVLLLVSYVLVFSVHVVRSEDNVREIKHFFRNFEFLFHCKLGYAVGVFGFWVRFLIKGRLPVSRKLLWMMCSKHFTVVEYREVDEILPRPTSCFFIIESLDEMTESFGRIGSQVKNVIDGMFLE